MSIVAPGVDVGLASVFVHRQTLDRLAVTLWGTRTGRVSVEHSVLPLQLASHPLQTDMCPWVTKRRKTLDTAADVSGNTRRPPAACKHLPGAPVGFIPS